MRKLILIVLVLVMASPVLAVTTLTTSISRPDIDRFRVLQFTLSNKDYKEVLIQSELGYADGATFIPVGVSVIRITNLKIMNGRNTVAAANSVGVFEGLPVAYQTNPANKVITEINAGTFGAQDTALEYIENIVKALLGL